MVADRSPTRENPSLTCGFSHSRPGGAGHTWRNLSCPAGPCERVCAFVTSDGIGTDDCGATEPLCVTSDGIGGTDGFGGTEPLRDGHGRVVAGQDPGVVRLVRAWSLPLASGGPLQRPRRPLVSGRPERCDGECIPQAPGSPAGTRHCERRGH